MSQTVIEDGHNKDLVKSKQDVEWVKTVYPDLEWLAIDPDARFKFGGLGSDLGDFSIAGADEIVPDSYEGRANRAKSSSRSLGTAAILTVVASLLIVAFEPFLHGGGWLVRAMVFIAPFLGIIGGAIGALGILRGTKKDEWLENRVLTERIRQQYFQFLVRRVASIATVRGQLEIDRLMRERRVFWANFEKEYERAKSGKWVTTLIEDTCNLYAWLVPKEATVPEVDIEQCERLLSFYRKQRFEGQLDYARWMQRDSGGIFSGAPRTQIKTINGVAIYCVALLFTLHIILGVALLLWPPVSWATLAHSATISLAVVALGAKTFEAGLRPDKELDRHRMYENRIMHYLEKFDSAITLDKKIEAMEDLELLSYWEMREFLRNHEEASFSM